MSEGGIRLHRFLATAGKGSRRACEDLIEQGRVMVDGAVVKKQGTIVVPGVSRVELDGQAVNLPRRIYYLLNKPRGFVCTNAAEEAPMRVIDLVPGKGLRLYVAGRLDRESDGLVFVTNDGDVAQTLTHPKHGVLKTYKVRVKGVPDEAALARLRQGVHIAEGKVKPKKVARGARGDRSCELTVVLGEGKNREVRRIFARVGYPVARLTRLSIGSFKVTGIAPGEYKELKQATVMREIERIESCGRQAEGPPKQEREGRSKPGPRPRKGSGKQARPPKRQYGGKAR